MKADILPAIGIILIFVSMVFLFTPSLDSMTQQISFLISLVSGVILSTVVYARLEKRERMKQSQHS